MKNSFFNLYLEITKQSLTFYVLQSENLENFKILHKSNVKISESEDYKFFDIDRITEIVKKNIYHIEQEINYTFKDVILILENFNPTFINLSGYKRLNGSQIVKANITYILNILKSYLNNTELEKTIIHIFNTKFSLDGKKIDNLPIGLFGDFYSHELSFVLIDKHNFNSINTIFDNSNLNIRKILLKSFVEGVYTSNIHRNTETFFFIKFNEKNSKIFYFENSSLKISQSFEFGTDILIKDVSKITNLSEKTVKNILNIEEIHEDLPEDSIIQKSLFINDEFKKVSKNLIYKIILARVKELSEIILFNNINFKYYKNLSNTIFLNLSSNGELKSLLGILKTVFSKKGKLDLRTLRGSSDESMLRTAHELVHYGWKKEAIPTTKPQKSIIRRVFDKIFD